MKPINVGLLGIGTVGGGTFNVLARNEAEITRRAGRPIRITKVADKDLELARQVTGGRPVGQQVHPIGRQAQAACGALRGNLLPCSAGGMLLQLSWDSFGC